MFLTSPNIQLISNSLFFVFRKYDLAYYLLSCVEIVKFHVPSFASMNLRNGPLDKSNNNRTAKAIAAIPIAGILVAAAFMSGLLSVIGSETAIAQQNVTGTNATATNATATNATATNATATNATATNATGTTTENQTATGSQTGTATNAGGNNNAGTTGSYY
jgi:hypothetical protein